MRTFEIILLLTVTILPFVKRPISQRISGNYLLIILGIILTLHLLVEGWRWQMFPAYLLTLILAWRVKVIDHSQAARLSVIRIAGFLGVVIIVFLGWLLSLALPVFDLPVPTGPYSVGTQDFHLQSDLDESITEDPNDQRELMLKIWYPSESDSSATPDRYIDAASRSGFATKYGMPPNALNYLDRVRTHAFTEIPPAQGPFPVLIFSHGYGSKATGYYSLLTEIASQGYIIINMNHTYESLGATFPDGRQVHFDYGFQHKISQGSMDVVQPLIDAFKDGLDYEQRHPIVEKSVRNYFEADIQDRWATDIIFTIDLLEKWNTEGWLRGKMDLDKLGVFGHSVGGGTAGRVAIRDTRVKAAVNLDGIQWGQMIDSVYHIPYLYISADWPAEHEDINSHVYINKSTDYFYETKLLQSGHPNFMDIPFMIPIPAVAGTGQIDAQLGMEIVNRLVISFFDKHLKILKESDPKTIGDEYELLEMVVHRGDSVG